MNHKCWKRERTANRTVLRLSLRDVRRRVITGLVSRDARPVAYLRAVAAEARRWIAARRAPRAPRRPVGPHPFPLSRVKFPLNKLNSFTLVYA